MRLRLLVLKKNSEKRTVKNGHDVSSRNARRGHSGLTFMYSEPPHTAVTGFDTCPAPARGQSVVFHALCRGALARNESPKYVHWFVLVRLLREVVYLLYW